MHPRRIAAALVCLALALACVFFAAPASAHAIGVSTGEYSAAGNVVRVKVAFARGDVIGMAPEVDGDGDGRLTPAELVKGRDAIDNHVVRKVVVSGDAEPCTSKLEDVALTEQDGVEIVATYACRVQPSRFEVSAGFLLDLPHGHRHIARAVGVQTEDAMLHRADLRFQVTPRAAQAVDAPKPASKSIEAPTLAGAARTVWMGVEHILTGPDHLLFLFGLILVRGRLKSILAVVTAFTIGHSIALALSVLDVWAPRPKLVEAAVALSIVYVGIENFIVKSARGRWRVTFPFGFIHGFAFAGALHELNLPRERLPAALLCFNVGVEIGQLAVLVRVLPLILIARVYTKWFQPKGVKGLSAAVVLAGSVWFVLRLVDLLGG
jgi:hydrogenase/urease accessory protein HupE